MYRRYSALAVIKIDGALTSIITSYAFLLFFRHFHEKYACFLLVNVSFASFCPFQASMIHWGFALHGRVLICSVCFS